MLSPRHFLIPWTGGAFAPLGPFLYPTTGENKMTYCPKARALGPVLSKLVQINIEKKFKKQNLLVSILKIMLCLNV
jgi:hypothetical protein